MECQTIESYDEFHNPVYKPKLSFPTMDSAIEFAKKVNLRDNVIHKVVAYKCTKCFKYHVGRNGKEIKEKERIKWKKQ